MMALNWRTATMAKDTRSHSTFDQAQAERETTGTLPIRERSVRKETNTLGFVGATSSATLLPLGDTSARWNLVIHFERRERELDRQRDGCHMPERH